MRKLEIYVDENKKEWFPANEIATILGYKNPQEAIRKHCNINGCVNRSVIANTGFGNSTQQKKYINEGNLYRLITKSKLLEAEKFETWVFDEVLPMIRKTGAYITDSVWDQITNDPAKFGEFLIDYEKTYTVTEIAKELGVSSVRILNQILFKDHINIISSIYKMEHGCYILAYNRSI